MANLLSILNTLRSDTPILRTINYINIDRDSISIGNNALVARCYINGCDKAMNIKCYHRPHHNLKTIYADNYYPQELGIYTLGGDIEYIDIVITPWIDGTSLDALLNKPDTDYLQLSKSFDAMARNLLEKPIAHGDIKPDNIIVCEDGDMKLVDWDAMWYPNIVTPIEECGTPTYRHPLRHNRDYNKHIDDYPLALISTMLAALASERSYFEPYISEEGGLFDPIAILKGEDMLLNHAIELFAQRGDASHYRIAKTLTMRHYQHPELSEYLSYSYIALPQSIPDGLVVECYKGLWGCHNGDLEWIIPPLYDSISVTKENKCCLMLGEDSVELSINGALSFDVDIPIDLELRMRRLEALRTQERAMSHIVRQSSCRTATNKNASLRWSFVDDERLVMMYSDGMSVRTIAYMLCRSEAAVRRRIRALHLPKYK